MLRSSKYVKCLHIYNEKRKARYRLVNQVDKKCTTCNSSFKTGYKHQVRCKNCIPRRLEQSIIKCVVCKKEFQKKRQKQVHCSETCYVKTYYYKRDIFKRRFYSRTRESKERGAHGKHSFVEWTDLKKRLNYQCQICKRFEPEIKLTIDHIVPISRGGTNHIENIQPLCQSCNSKKGNKIYA